MAWLVALSVPLVVLVRVSRVRLVSALGAEDNDIVLADVAIHATVVEHMDEVRPTPYTHGCDVFGVASETNEVDVYISRHTLSYYAPGIIAAASG
jgi:hypothetical protein